MTVRFCRACGTPAALEDGENRPGDPYACADCLRQLLDRAWVPRWVVRASRHLWAVS